MSQKHNKNAPLVLKSEVKIHWLNFPRMFIPNIITGNQRHSLNLSISQLIQQAYFETPEAVEVWITKEGEKWLSHVPVEALRGVTRYQTLVSVILVVFPPCHLQPMQSWRFQRAILALPVRFPCKYSFFELRSNLQPIVIFLSVHYCALNSKAYTKELNKKRFFYIAV